ncbi:MULTISPECIES: SDR family NAD(P)-dependent oxidoreductase [unclassified Nocardioides]|uniref:SDR family NAD(P)-dependent oxidoreductase n=1 Tax=unclassified Nocardioides TaxID=2615069 RepID=UPI00360E1BA0
MSHHPSVAVVTGAAQGLGRTFARTLAGLGHDVAVLDMLDTAEIEAEVAAAGRRFLGRTGDAADAATVADFATAVRAELGPARILVNNVGISPYRPFTEETLDSWHWVLRVNLDSAFLVTQAFLPDLRADGHGRIVNLTSSIVWDAAARDMVAYGTTKAALVGLTRGLATELGPDGVTVNCIAPGIVLTPDIEGRVPDEKLAAYRERQAVKQLARPEDLAATLRYLVGEDAQLVTGTVQAVNGGRVWT